MVSVGCYYIVEDGIRDVMGWNPTTGEPVGDSLVPGPRASFHQLANRLGGCTIVVLFEVKTEISI